MVRLYPPKNEPWLHWAAFFRYCCDKLDIRPNGTENAHTLFQSFGIYINEFGGRIIFPKPGSWSIECLEFDTPEDLIIFKLTFN